MNRIISLVLFLISLSQLHAQSLKFLTGPQIENFNFEAFLLFEKDSSNLYLFGVNGYDYFLNIYDRQTLAQSAHIKVPIPSEDTMEYNLKNLFVHEDTFQIIYSHFDWQSKYRKLEMVNFDKHGRKLGETRVIDLRKGTTERKAGDFFVFNDKTKNEFISYGYSNKKSERLLKINYFDYSGNKIHAESIMKSGDDGDLLYTFLLNGKLYSIKKRTDYWVDNEWSVHIYSPQSDSTICLLLKVPSSKQTNVFENFTSFKDKDGNINLVTTYSHHNPKTNPEGIYIATIDSSKDFLISESLIPFNRQPGDRFDKINLSLSEYIIKAIIPQENHRFRLVFEGLTYTKYTYPGTTAYLIYQSGNLIVMDIDSNRKVTEIHNIKKKQSTLIGSYKYSGSAILNWNDKTYYIYNELPENLYCEPDRMKEVDLRLLGTTEVIYTTIENHKVVRKILIDKNYEGTPDIILPHNNYSDWDNGELYVFRKINFNIYLTKIFAGDK